MQEQTPISAAVRPTQEQARPYSEHEEAIIAEIALRPSWRWKEIYHLFPGRSKAGVTKKIGMCRRAAGCSMKEFHPDDRKPVSVQVLDPDDPGLECSWLDKWSAHCKEANQTFVLALWAAA